MNNTRSYAPIALFVYNRPWHTKQTVEALQRCELAAESELYIFADGPKQNATEECKENIAAVREYIQSIEGFASITIDASPKNIGCADSIIRGVSKVIENKGKAIVVEDDIVAHPFFLRFMNEALDFYEKDDRIFCISATMENFEIPLSYACDVFLTYRTGSWGWATWSDRWQMINWDINSYRIINHPTKKQIKQFCMGGDDLWPMLNAQLRGEIDAWDIRFCYNMSLQEKLCLRSVKSFVNNIGMDNSGTHCGNSSISLLPQYDKPNYYVCMYHNLKTDYQISNNIKQIFRIKKKRNIYFRKLFNIILSRMHYVIPNNHKQS